MASTRLLSLDVSISILSVVSVVDSWQSSLASVVCQFVSFQSEWMPIGGIHQIVQKRLDYCFRIDDLCTLHVQ